MVGPFGLYYICVSFTERLCVRGMLASANCLLIVEYIPRDIPFHHSLLLSPSIPLPPLRMPAAKLARFHVGLVLLLFSADSRPPCRFRPCLPRLFLARLIGIPLFSAPCLRYWTLHSSLSALCSSPLAHSVEDSFSRLGTCAFNSRRASHHEPGPSIFGK